MPRPALKTLTYSVMHFTVAITVAFALTGSWQAALAIGMIEPLVQTLAYALHERAWACRGRPADPAAAIEALPKAVRILGRSSPPENLPMGDLLQRHGWPVLPRWGRVARENSGRL